MAETCQFYGPYEHDLTLVRRMQLILCDVENVRCIARQLKAAFAKIYGKNERCEIHTGLVDSGSSSVVGESVRGCLDRMCITWILRSQMVRRMFRVELPP